MKTHSRGFSLIEVMIASAIVAIALLSSLTGLAAAQRLMHDTRARIGVRRLAESRIQRVLLQNKSMLVAGCWSSPGVPASNNLSLATGTAPWTTEANPGSSDVSGGSYFNVSPQGDIVPLTAAQLPGNPGCAAAPKGTYCRETYVSCGPPTEATNTPAAWASTAALNSKLYTLWVRVSKVGDPNFQSVVHREVFTP